MKILLLQLARLGDIFQTWPTISALKRTYPGCEVHILTRKKFSIAAEMHPEISKVWCLDSEHILEPLGHSAEDYKISISRINNMVDDLSSEGFDHLINLTFSSFSSFLTFKIKALNKKGYSRYEDGSPFLADPISSFFYAQVGIGEANRIHVCDLFAKVSGVTLAPIDWSFTKTFGQEIRSEYIVIHLGASDPKKCLPITTWTQVCSQLAESGTSIVLVGSESEKHLSQFILANLPKHNISDQVGKTTLPELFNIIAAAKIFVGCDSGPQQIASLLNTKSLNLSFQTVNFWETGPKSSGSQILYADLPSELSAEKIIDAIYDVIAGTRISGGVVVPGPTEEFECDFILNSFKWDLIKYLYFKGSRPVLNKNQRVLIRDTIHSLKLLQRYLDEFSKDPGDKSKLELINKHEAKIQSLSATTLRPIGFWFQTQKMNVPPVDFETVVFKTKLIYRKLDLFLNEMIVNTNKFKESANGHYELEA